MTATLALDGNRTSVHRGQKPIDPEGDKNSSKGARKCRITTNW